MDRTITFICLLICQIFDIEYKNYKDFCIFLWLNRGYLKIYKYLCNVVRVLGKSSDIVSIGKVTQPMGQIKGHSHKKIRKRTKKFNFGYMWTKIP